MAHPSRGRWPGFVSVAVAAVAGCGGGSLSFDEAQQRVYVALCHAEVNCGDMPDIATCMASLQVEPGYSMTIDADIASGKIVYDGAKASTCVARLESVYDGPCTRSARAAAGSTDAACAGVFAGTVDAGGACFFDEECRGGGRCQSTDASCSRSRQCCAGTCLAAPAPIPAGGDCTTQLPNQGCGTGSYCILDASGTSSTCMVPSAGEGAPCASALLCAQPFYCDFDPATNTGTCKRPAATGAPCNPNSSGCDSAGDYCDMTTSTCTPRVAAGGTCDPTQFNCVGYTECVGTTCVARARVGESCAASSGVGCLGSLACDATTSTCTLAPVGGACI